MAFLTPSQVEAILAHMSNDESVLDKKFKAKNSPTSNISVLHGEKEAYEKLEYTVTTILKTKVRMSRPKPCGVQLEDDIWCMFYKLGFRILNKDEKLFVQWGTNESDRHQLDVVAVGEEAIFVVECKAAETARNRSFKDEINIMTQYRDGVIKSLRQIYGENKKVKFILATRNYRIGQEDVSRMNANHIFHLNDNTYDYICNLIKSYKSSVIYQFYGLMFKDELINNQKIKIPALKGSMGGQNYYLFSIEPSTLLKIGFVLHRTRVNDSMAPTYQRLLMPNRLKGITKFINEGGYFPNSIIINFAAPNHKLRVQFEPAMKSEDSKARFGILTIPNAYGIAYIIDGQHRVYGYAASDYKDKNTIPVVAFEDMPSEDQLRIFMEINENQKAVSPSLRLDLEEDLYWNSDRLDSRMKALRSSIIKNLAANSNYVLYNKISVGEDPALLSFKPFDTAFSKSSLIPSATQSKFKEGAEYSIYDIKETNSGKAMEDSRKNITQYINGVYSIMEQNLVKEKQNVLLFSNRGTFPLIVLAGSLHKYLLMIGTITQNSTINDRIAAVKPYFETLCDALNKLDDDKYVSLKGHLGQGADTYWLRTFQDILNNIYPEYCPEELLVWKEKQDQTLQDRGRKLKSDIQQLLKNVFFSKLEVLYSDKWELQTRLVQNECERRIIKSLGDEDIDFDAYDWRDYMEVSEYKSLIEKNFSNKEFSEPFSIDLGEGFKTKKERLAWLSRISIPKGKKVDELTQQDIDKLQLIYSHLNQFSDLY